MVINDLWLLVMSRVIFSFYIDIPSERLVSHEESKIKFNNSYEWLKSKQIEYANKIGVDYKHFIEDQQFTDYRLWFEENYPEITYYNIVNFYKIHLLYKLAEEYDEILYMDMDVIPVTDLNFFEEFDLSKGYAIMTGTAQGQQSLEDHNMYRYKHHVRSPMAKLWNTKCLLQEYGYPIDNVEIFNTGIVGISKKHLQDLAYFEDFDDTINTMTDLQTDDFYPPKIREMFGYDNETIWGLKTICREVPYQQLANGWHHFMDKWSYIPDNSKFVHCVSKDFDYVRNWCEKNNL